MRTFFAVGGDMRLRWMVQILSKEGYPVSFFTGTDSPLMKSAVKEASVILGPVPFHIYKLQTEIRQEQP